MTDFVDPATRSRMMASVRNKDTKPERALRHALHARGLRYRLHSGAIVGRPDIVLPRHRAAVLVHGCFWHRHRNCRHATIPATRPEFWNAKFEVNVARDAAVKADLLGAGWRVATIWECALRKRWQIEESANLPTEWLATDSLEIEIGENKAVGIATIT